MRHKRWEETVEKDGETGGIAPKEGTYIELRKEMILSQKYQPVAHPTPVDTVCEPNIDRR